MSTDGKPLVTASLLFYERCSDVDDILLNTTGVAIGALYILAAFARVAFASSLLITSNRTGCRLATVGATCATSRIVLRTSVGINKDENIIFGWVMDEQSIIDSITDRLNTANCNVKKVSLMVDENNLRARLMAYVESNLRSTDVIDRSIPRIPLYQNLNTLKIDTNNKTIQAIANEIKMYK